MSTMTNDQIVAEFNDLFGSGETPEEEDKPEEAEVEEPATPETESEKTEETPAEEEPAEAEEDPSTEETVTEEPDKSKKQAQQNYTFAAQRRQIKEQETFIKSVGKLIGFDDKASLDEIQDKIKDVLIERQSKETGVPKDVLQRLEIAEQAILENNKIKLETHVTENFADLIEKHKLTKPQIDEFTQYLISEGKNPMQDATVDVKAEYLKLHLDDIIAQRVAEDLEKERKRKEKADTSAASANPKAPDKSSEERKIETVKDLDDLFKGMTV